MLFESARAWSDRPFLIDSQTRRTLTYGEFLTHVDGLASTLAEAGVGPGRNVALLLKNGIELIVAELACLRAGATVVPVNPTLSPGDIAYILETTRPVLLVRQESTEPLLSALDANRERVRELVVRASNEASGQGTGDWSLESPPPAAPLPGRPLPDIATIHHTSGTTGRPKGVAHRLDALLASARAFNRLVGIDGESRLLHVMPMAYMAGFLNTVLCPWVVGGSVVLAPAFDARTAFVFWQPVIEHRVNALWLSPTMLASLLRLDRDPRGAEYARTNIRTVSVGTAPLSRATEAAFKQRYGLDSLESYGLSETLFVTSNTPTGPFNEGSVGPLLDGVRCRLVGPEGADARAGGEGEIHIQSDFMFAGYVDPATGQVERVARDSWFPSGDLGKIDDAGRLFITGRKKDLIIRGGINVSPLAVEDVLAEHPRIARVAVVGLPHDVLGEEVVAALVLDRPGTFEESRQGIIAHAKARLGAVQVPTRWFELPELPVSSTGKVQKAELRRRLLDLVGGGSS